MFQIFQCFEITTLCWPKCVWYVLHYIIHAPCDFLRGTLIIEFYLESAFNQFNFAVVFQDVHVAWSTIFGINSEIQIIGPRAACQRNASRFLIFKMTNKIAGGCSWHSRFLGGIESFQNHRVFHSIGKYDINGRNFPDWSGFLNFNQGQSYIKRALLFMYQRKIVYNNFLYELGI